MKDDYTCAIDDFYSAADVNSAVDSLFKAVDIVFYETKQYAEKTENETIKSATIKFHLNSFLINHLFNNQFIKKHEIYYDARQNKTVIVLTDIYKKDYINAYDTY